MRSIELPSLQSLYLNIYDEDNEVISTGTGFVVENKESYFLITNKHVVTGVNTETGSILGKQPFKIGIFHNKGNFDNGDSFGCVGERIEQVEELYADNSAIDKLWFEHPDNEKRIDVIALKLTQLDGVVCHPYKIMDVPQYQIFHVPQKLNVVGFPFSKFVGDKLAVWSTGYLASEPCYDYDDRPIFLIDCKTRKGQSGSPVITYSPGGGQLRSPHSDVCINTHGVCNLLGIYSGRVNENSDLGMVWKYSVIREILVPGN